MKCVSRDALDEMKILEFINYYFRWEQIGHNYYININ